MGRRATVPNAVTDEENISLNNNRNNNRRRGRGNRNQGGGNNANRIDSRARGNAPQLLDKYKKLAQDAQHNGDRVQAEYYLQFADHYFRVIADNKARQEEARSKRGDERDQQGDDDDGDDRRRNSRNSRGQRGSRREDLSEGDRGEEGDEIAAGEQEGESGQDNQKPRRARNETRKPRRKSRDDDTSSDSGEIDAGALPPAIGADRDSVEVEVKPRRRRKPVSDDSGDGDDGLQAVG